jgi:hypothetical protein
MNPSMNPLLHFHPLIAGRLNGAIQCSTNGQFVSIRHLESTDWVIAFCYGHSWCGLISKVDYLAFLSSDMGQPVKEEFAYSIPVPQVLDKSCEELLTYQLETLTLALAHFSLQLHLHQANPYALDNRANIFRS